MAVPEILRSLHGRALGLDSNSRLIAGGNFNRGVSSLVVYTNEAASTAITNTVTQTRFDTYYSIPANSLRPGQLIKVRYQGIATSTNSTDTLAVTLYLGGTSGTALLTHAATDVANNNVFSGEYELIVRTVGASGTIVGCGTKKNVAAAEGTATYADDILASTTIDTTAAQELAAYATWSVASASNSVRMDFFRVEIA